MRHRPKRCRSFWAWHRRHGKACWRISSRSAAGVNVLTHAPRFAPLALLAIVVALAGCSRTERNALSTSQALQQCVDRWNWMHYHGAFSPTGAVVPARVATHPCRIKVAYRFEKSNPAYKHYLSTYFPCRLNRYGAFVCALHASGPVNGPPLRGLNASWDPGLGVMRLYDPPAHSVPAAKPEWVRRYPVQDGFIVPFTRSGRLRRGLALVRRPSLTCEMFTNIGQRWPAYDCGGAGELYCFPSTLSPRNNQLAACSSSQGSRLFRRAILRPPAP
jgi:hypothetical protein